MKKIIIPILFLCLMALAVFAAAPTVQLDPNNILANLTYYSSSTANYNVLVTGNITSYVCSLYTNENGSNGIGVFHEEINDLPVTNATNTTFTAGINVADVTGTSYCWDVFCNGTGDRTGAWGAGSNTTHCGTATGGSMNFSIDTTDPVMVVTPGNYVWDTDGLVDISVTANDSNPGFCILSTTMNYTGNGTNQAGNISLPAQAYVNNTAQNFVGFNDSGTMDDNNTNAYYFDVQCNDSAGNVNSIGQRYVLIDTVAPSAFFFNYSLWRTDGGLLIENNTWATDYKPQIGWNTTADLNFSRYLIEFFLGSWAGASVDTNVTTITTLAANLSSYLAADSTYLINITAFDLAGNSVSITEVGEVYKTDSTNRVLSSGWNIIGNVGNAFSLSELLNWSGATTASIWNSSHQFESHVAGGSYGQTNVNPGEGALIYLSSATNYTDLVRNTSAFASFGGLQVNLTKASMASNWSLVMNKNDTANRSFQHLDNFLNLNLANATTGSYAPQNDSLINSTTISYYNNTNSWYYSFIGNWSWNNNTEIEFGEPIWIFSNSTSDYDVLDWEKNEVN